MKEVENDNVRQTDIGYKYEEELKAVKRRMEA